MIVGGFDPDRGPHPFVRAAVKIERLVPRWRFIDFVIDTGASMTVVHPHDSIYRLLLPIPLLQNVNAWPTTRVARGVNGDTRLFEVAATLGFLDGDDLREFVFPLSIAQMTATNRELPSLLGWDILQTMDVRLNRSQGVVEMTFTDA